MLVYDLFTGTGNSGTLGGISQVELLVRPILSEVA